MKATCPICGGVFDRASSEHLPFCSARCKMVDLGNWLDERYRVPADRDDDPRDEQGPADDRSEP